MSKARPSSRGGGASMPVYDKCHLHGFFACPCLCMCLYIPMTYDHIVICPLCAPAVYGQCVEAKRKSRSLPQASSVADLLEGVYMVCDYGFVLNMG